MVRAFAHGAIGRQIDPSFMDPFLRIGRKGNVLFKDALNTFYIRLYMASGIR